MGVGDGSGGGLGPAEGTARIVLRGEAQAQLVELLPAVVVQRSEELVFELADQCADLAELRRSRRGDADDVPPSVLRVALARDQAALLERVEQGDEPARIDP